MIKCISITVLCIGLCGCATHMLTSSNTANADTSGEFSGTNEIITAQHGIASWYNIKTNYGTQTASGRPLHNDALTAAHKEWPMGSKVKVTNLRNGHSEVLTITDRGPYIKGRVIDVTAGSAKRLGFYENGLTRTKIELLSRGNWKYQH